MERVVFDLLELNVSSLKNNSRSAKFIPIAGFKLYKLRLGG